MITERKQVAIVVQRYGHEVLGGSESLAMSIARSFEGVCDVDVLTTCAVDYLTWNNELPEGDTRDGEATVKRFCVDRPRSPWFSPYNVLIKRLPHTRAMEERWLKMQGPYSSRLLDYISQNKNRYGVFIFVTYLYATTYYGMKAAGDRAVLVPTAHDEPFIRFGMYRDMFRSARKIIYLTPEEKSFSDGLFGLDSGKSEVIGVPVEMHGGSAEAFRGKFGIEGDFILYVGRIDKMKGLDRLTAYFQKYAEERGGDIKLVLCGKGSMKLPDSGLIVPLGYLSEEDKFGAMKAAIATVQPSRFESYSIVVIESMLCGTPVLVNGNCQVLRGHCARSGAGECYDSYEEFAEALDRLRRPAVRSDLGERGRTYAETYYSVDGIRRQYISTIDGLIS